MSQLTNISNKIITTNLATRTFTNDKGSAINYHKIIITIQLNGKDFDIETKIDKRDAQMLQIADELTSNESFLDS